MKPLRNITADFKSFSKMVEESEGDLPLEAIKDTFEMIEGEFEEKVKSVSLIIKNIDDDVLVCENEIKRLQERKRIMENKAKSIKDYLLHNMIQIGITKISSPLITITRCKGREVVSIYDEDELPEDLVKAKTELVPDKKEIKKRLDEDPESVPGAKLTRNSDYIKIK